MSQEIAFREIKGKVQAVNDQDEKDYYGICINDEWFNGEDSTDIQKGDTVKLAVKESDEEFIDIQAAKTIQDDGQSKDSEKVSSKSREGAAPNPTLSKDQQIRKSLAFKKACDKVPYQLGFDGDSDKEDYKERVKELMQVHEEILEEEMQ